jgi:DNA repair exonuclease SbcCD ATPase subunit
VFHKLDYSVTFDKGPNGPRTLRASLNFTTGFTVISGPNEAGKSFVFEMMRFALFGTQALRGAAEDYKSLRMSAEVDIRGERYRIDRNIDKATLYRGGQVVCNGVRAVNDKIVRILGFGLQVFDVACSVNQGEVERLGAMAPAERKKMVDGVVGIDTLDVVAKWFVDEAKVFDREAEAIRSRLVVPVRPAVPDGYRSSAEIPLETARAQARELAELTGWLAHARPKPAEPTCKVDLPAVNLTVFANKRRKLREEIADLEAVPHAVAFYTDAQLDEAETDWQAYVEYENAQAWLRNNPAPRATGELQLDVFEDDWTAIHNVETRASLCQRIKALQEKGFKLCPHCGGEIPLEEDAIEQLVQQHDALPVPDSGRAPPTPPLTPAEIAVERQRLKTWDAAKAEQMRAVAEIPRPGIPKEDIPVHRTVIKQAQAWKDAQGLLAATRHQFAEMPDYETMLIERQAYEEALPRYRQELADWEAWNTERQKKELRRTQLAGAEATLAALEAEHRTAVAFEQQLAVYEAARQAYETGERDANDLTAKAERYRKVRDVMAVLRSLIKQHLLPSLNTVASALLAVMTGGQRRSIYVDEEFDVLVDGQRLNTLSGSGKACANLALRIALGQVLTNRVVSVLLADEIDGSMDDFRAEKTSQILWNLTNSISQVLLVSHKQIEGEHHVRIGGLSGDGEPADLLGSAA